MRRLAAVLGLSVLAFAGLAAGIFATGGGARTTAAQATTRVTVVATEFKFKLSKRSARAGTVIFTVKNKGKIAHDFKIAGKKTKTLRPGQTTVLRVKMTKGRKQYICTLPGHAKAGMKGAFVVGSATGPPPPPPPTTTTPTTTTTTTVTGPSTTVTVGMFEYRFDISPATIPAGNVTFVITNNGQEPHNFDISGVRAGAILGPGQTETWTVGLAARNYIVVCDVPFHIDRGMTTQMTIS
jgi:uncharacterized cupredoxin-like copper-binding protein